MSNVGKMTTNNRSSFLQQASIVLLSVALATLTESLPELQLLSHEYLNMPIEVSWPLFAIFWLFLRKLLSNTK